MQPDITAPGVNILAAKFNYFEFESGTSMATPFIAGIAALVKSVHPNWSPAAIKSAIMIAGNIIISYIIFFEKQWSHEDGLYCLNGADH